MTTGRVNGRRSPAAGAKTALIVFAVIVLSVMTAASCSRSPGDLAGAPEPVGGEATGPVATDGSTSTQSFRVTGHDSEVAIADYQKLATDAGWMTTEAPAATGDTDWILTMTKDGATLRVTTSPFKGDSGPADDIVEISLEVTTGS